MPEEATQGLVIRAYRTTRCPVFRPGDVITLCGRSILCSHFSAYCAFQFAQIRPVLKALEKGLDIGTIDLPMRDGFFECRDYNCHGLFEFHLVTPQELGTIRGTIGLVEAHTEVRRLAAPAELQPAAQPTAPSPAPAAQAVAAASPAPAQTLEPMPAVSADDAAKAAQSTQPVGSYDLGIDGNASSEKDEQRKPFLRRMRPDLALALIQAGTLQRFPDRIEILSEGQVNQYLYLVRRGEVAIEKKMDDGSTLELARLQKGEAFGEMSLLSSEPCNATARACGEIEVVAIHQDELDHVMAVNPALHRWFSHLFVERMHSTNQQLAERLAGGMSGRLALIGLLDVLQTLMIARQTGRLRVRRRQESGVLYLHEGQVLDATLGRMKGEDAVFAMARWTEGTFSFSQEERLVIHRTVERDTMHLMMDAARILDEGTG